MSESHLETRFRLLWENLSTDFPAPVQEYLFAKKQPHPRRKPRGWRFDFAWLEQKVAVEMEGGTWVQGRHSRGTGATSDAEKYNYAALTGWTVIRFTSDMFKNDPAGCIEIVQEMLEIRGVKLEETVTCL